MRIVGSTSSAGSWTTRCRTGQCRALAQATSDPDLADMITSQLDRIDDADASGKNA